MQPGSPRRQLLITVGLVILLVIFLFLLVDIGAVIDILGQADWGLLLLGVPFLLLCFLLLLIRWRYLLGNAPTLKETQHVLFSGMMVSITTPFRIRPSAWSALAARRMSRPPRPRRPSPSSTSTASSFG